MRSVSRNQMNRRETDQEIDKHFKSSALSEEEIHDVQIAPDKVTYCDETPVEASDDDEPMCDVVH